MRTPHLLFAAACLLVLSAPARAPARAQDAAASPGPTVGEMAPDFTLPGSTKDGALALPVHLSDLRGQTVVLAFFPRARTAG